MAQAAPLVTSLAMPVANFDAYLAAWRAGRARFSDEAERLVDRWARFAFSPRPDGRYRQRALRTAVEAEWRSIVATESDHTTIIRDPDTAMVDAIRSFTGPSRSPCPSRDTSARRR